MGKPTRAPSPKEILHVHTHHGVRREDPWHWLQNLDDPEVVAHLKAENAYTEAMLLPVRGLNERLYQDLLGRIEESNCSAPYPDGDYLYQSRIDKGENYRRYYRRPRNRDGDWVLYFDACSEAWDKAYFELAFLDISPDGRVLAYALDTSGDELYTLKFRDLDSGTDLPDEITGISGEGEWDAGSSHYYFVREDESRRPFRIHRHRLGDVPSREELVWEETDPKFYLGLTKSQDMQYLFASSESKETTESLYLPAHDTNGKFRTLYGRRPGIRYWVEHRKGKWLIRTNEGAPDFKLVSCPADRTDEAPVTLVEDRKGVRLDDVIPLENHLVLMERCKGLDRIRILSMASGEEHLISQSDEVYDLHPGINAKFETEEFTFVYSSPVRPPETIRYHLRTREREVIRRTQVPSGHTPEDYSAYRINVPSADGTPVPMTLIHRKDLLLDGSRPAVLHGYGAYGSTMEAAFRSSWLTWMQRGFTVAIAHVRGGGLLGEDWYQAGKLANKENSFNDFIACAEALVSGKYTNTDKLLIEGDSAGGLLVGAVLNKRPDLFKAALAEVPFVDALNTMLDEDLPLTTFEYEEWGNPNDRTAFDTIHAYSPYDNVRPVDYPAILVTAGFNDSRVPCWEAAKWVARLRKLGTGTNPILLQVQFDSGHAGASGRYDFLREIAFQQSFLLAQVEPGQEGS
jgi:oligopeptidase B